MRRHVRRVAAVLWSGFLVAAALELAVFAFVDPQTLHGLSGALLHASATAVYSLAFLVFWAAGAAGAALSLLLDGSAEDINAAGAARSTRGSGTAPS